MHEIRAWLAAAGVIVTAGLVGYEGGRAAGGQTAPEVRNGGRAESLLGAKAGDALSIGGVELRWCPPGRFRMGSPRTEPERRPGEDQVDVTLTRDSGSVSTR